MRHKAYGLNRVSTFANIDHRPREPAKDWTKRSLRLPSQVLSRADARKTAEFADHVGLVAISTAEGKFRHARLAVAESRGGVAKTEDAPEVFRRQPGMPDAEPPQLSRAHGGQRGEIGQVDLPPTAHELRDG